VPRETTYIDNNIVTALAGMCEPETAAWFPFTASPEYAPDATGDQETKDVVWFALNDDRPLTEPFARNLTESKATEAHKFHAPIPGPASV